MIQIIFLTLQHTVPLSPHFLLSPLPAPLQPLWLSVLLGDEVREGSVFSGREALAVSMGCPPSQTHEVTVAPTH